MKYLGPHSKYNMDDGTSEVGETFSKTLIDTEVLKGYGLDRAGITVMVNLIRVITTLSYLATGGSQQCSVAVACLAY